jgi:hypothetical protein
MRPSRYEPSSQAGTPTLPNPPFWRKKGAYEMGDLGASSTSGTVQLIGENGAPCEVERGDDLTVQARGTGNPTGFQAMSTFLAHGHAGWFEGSEPSSG